jgi:tetratricopeptide (TPR) repeat protein
VDWSVAFNALLLSAFNLLSRKRNIMISSLYLIAAYSAVAISASADNLQSNASEQGLEALYKTSDYDKAIKCFTRAIKEASNNKSLYYCYRGVSYQKKGDYDKAIADFTEAIRIDPNIYQAYVARGDVFYQKQDFRKALADYDVGIHLNPNRSVSYFNRGLIRDGLQQYEEAIRDYSKAIQINPKFAEAHIVRGNAFRALNANRDAIDDYSTALKYAPNNVIAFNNRGLAYHASESYALAIKDFSKTIECDPNNPLGYYQLAWELSTCPQDILRDGKRAVDYAKKACKLTKWKKPSYYGVLAAAYAECGSFDLAIKWETKALADTEYAKLYGDQVRARLDLYKKNQPYRDKPRKIIEQK